MEQKGENNLNDNDNTAILTELFIRESIVVVKMCKGEIKVRDK